MKNRTIKVDYLARVEGEGGLFVKVKDNKVVDVKLNIFEPPRFYEAFLRGRHFTEVPDITARICGICPVAYQTSSVRAMETACGATVDGQLRALRRLLYCGEYIESHVLHIYMLHAPDFLGCEDVLDIAKTHPDLVKKALRLKKIGNDIMVLLGGREIHPINVRVGGFYKLPTKAELQTLVEPLRWALKTAVETVAFTGTLPFPDYEQDYEFVSLRHPDEYPLFDGRIVSNKGIDIAIDEFFQYFEEEHVAHSTSLHSVVKARGAYHVGPMARYSLNFDRLPEVAQKAAKKAGLKETCTNPFKSIIVRAVETVFACHEALRIIDEYEQPEKPFVEVVPKAVVGHGASEAPRGMLYHRYRIGADGLIQEARIVPPTAQNQKVVEHDLFEYVSKYIRLAQDKLTWQCEQMVRNYDPCISCSCHFLKLHLDRQ